MYQILRSIISFGLKQFFQSIQISGAAPEEKSPLLIVSNHPNMGMDTLVIGYALKRDLWFIAKSTLFTNPIAAKLLRAIHTIPIYRKRDGADMSKNDESFREVVKCLSHYGACVIFPEGTSIGGRKLLPLKSGAARIAFLGEESCNFTLGLKIQPVGITYSNPVQFKSDVTIMFGTPIELANYEIEYKDDPRRAVDTLTDHIEAGLRKVTVDIAEEDNEIAQKISKLYGEGATEFQKLSVISKNLQMLAPTNPELVQDLKQRIDQAVSSDAGVIYDGKTTISLFKLALAIVGAVLNYIPYRLCGRLAKSFSEYEVELGSNKLLAGIVIFPLWFIFVGIIAGLISGNAGVALLCIGICAGTGYAVSQNYYDFQEWILAKFVSDKMQVKNFLQEQLKQELESLREL